MNKTSKVLASIALAAVAAFGVSACKMPFGKPKDTPPASSVAEAEPVTPADSSATPPVSNATAPASSATSAPASGAVAAKSAKPG